MQTQRSQALGQGFRRQELNLKLPMTLSKCGQLSRQVVPLTVIGQMQQTNWRVVLLAQRLTQNPPQWRESRARGQ
ncbi:hypothetical protein D3C72_1720960 [compost metagenome]